MFDIDDLVLAVVEGSGGKTEGRTRLQKFAYFVSELLSLPAGFEPHYYGPYSSWVTAAAESQVSRGLLRENIEEFPSLAFSAHDPHYRHYTYELTDKGTAVLRKRKEKDRDAYERAQHIVETLHRTNADYRLLSYAAKLYLILKQSGSPVTPQTASEHMREYGWPMEPEQMKEAANLLAQVGLIQKRQSDT